MVRSGEDLRSGEGLLALGGPAFDGMTGGSLRADGRFEETGTPAYRQARTTCEDLRSLRFRPLASAEAEAKDVASMWAATQAGTNAAVDLLLGPDASESMFAKMAPGRRVLHIATHGFVAQGACDRDGEDPLNLDQASPIFLSGLALAGANQRREAWESGREDGILLAAEVASQDLSDVDLAVLSACETGVGTVQAGEGVLGLRRSFEVAGVRSLVMSLWPVEDEATRLWMRFFYETYLGGRSVTESVRQAGLGILSERREKGLSSHPFFWGAFVSTGGWE